MTGRIVQVSGSVINVEFDEGQMPKINDALTVELNGKTLVMEVAQHIGNNTVKCIMLSGSEGMSSGMEVTATGGAIKVPVGDVVLGRMFNVLGEPIDDGEPIPEDQVERIWDKFYKVDKARTREYGGHGIGLSIVKAIMESFKQDYGVRNYENGVEFWFELSMR